MLPLVSIIVRSMARASLADALASIARQDYPRLEVVVVAACGLANHPALGTAGAHPVRLVGGAPRLTRPQAANAGLDAAHGDWITFLDDDDLLLANHVAGLVDVARRADGAKVVYTLAHACFRNGRTSSFGQPFALHELYERNFIHLAAALVSSELIAAGCRFDESLEIMEDWDFFIQCAQHARFHFEPRQTFQWNADVGDSGAGAGANQDDARFATFRDRVYAKWASRYDALVARVAGDLARAAQRGKAGDLAAAEALCRDVLAASQNDAFALNLLAMVQRSAGRLAAARATQALACAVRPHDASLARNLALLEKSRSNVSGANRHAEA
jgi:hypothetical protein